MQKLVISINSAPTHAPRFLQAYVNISNLTCRDCLLLNWFPIKKKGIYKILTPVSFVGRVAKCSCFIFSNMFQKQFHKEMKVVCFSVLSSAPTFLSRSVSPINNSSKTLVNLTKFATEEQTSLQLTLNSYMVRKIRQIIFLLFYVKDLLTTRKNS